MVNVRISLQSGTYLAFSFFRQRASAFSGPLCHKCRLEGHDPSMIQNQCMVPSFRALNLVMSSLLDAIQFIPANDEEVEDIFAFAPGLIFTDDLRVSHGDRGATIVYHNAQFGAIRLRTAEPANEHDRRLYSHYLWNSGIKMADLIADKQHPTWNVEGESVLELGAGRKHLMSFRHR